MAQATFNARFLVHLVCAVALFAAPVAAQDCMQFDGTFFVTSSCAGDPANDRALSLTTMRWGAAEYLVGNTGNELRMWNINSPGNPSVTTNSSMCREWGTGGYPCASGDLDYNLEIFSVCDDCRYGAAAYVTGIALFDLGTGAAPTFVEEEPYPDAVQLAGVFTFKVNSQQYLIAKGLGDTCSTGSAVYEFNGVDAASNPVVQCLDYDVKDGVFIPNGGDPYVWLATGNNRIAIHRVVPVGGSVELQFQSDDMRALVRRGMGVAVDEASGLAASTYLTGTTRIYDVGWGNGSYANPIEIGSINHGQSDPKTAVAIKAPFLWVAYETGLNSNGVYDISNPSNPQEIDPDFWDPSNSWNDYECDIPHDGVFSPSGSHLYLARYHTGQTIDISACGGGAPPTAAVSLSPFERFPGDTVTVNNSSTGQITEGRIWVTTDSSPDGQVVCETASTVTSPAPQSLDCDIPADVAAVDERWAHVAVGNDDFPYPGVGQLASREVTLNRAPETTISYDATDLITGNDATFTALAGGSPDSVMWHFTKPGGRSIEVDGEVAVVTLDETGPWIIRLTASYLHEAADGSGLYVYTTPDETATVRSVVADFGYTPSSPLDSDDIILTSTSNAAADAVLDYDWDVIETGSTSVVNSLSSCDVAGVTDLDRTCTIQAGTLAIGSYRFRLTLTNTVTDETDVALAPVTVSEFVPADFTWSPTQPEIGESVLFNITGTSGSIEEAVWNFGGSGCSPYTQTWTCTPGVTSCTFAPYEYSSSGTKNVTLVSVTIDDTTHDVNVTHQVTVLNSGSCGGTTSCSYTLSPSSDTAPATAGTDSFSVSTQSGCSWTASTTTGWIDVLSGSGSGSSAIGYSWDANSGGQRSGTIRVLGDGQSKTFTLTQSAAGGGCDYAINPTSANLPIAGGTGSVGVDTSPGCAWTATSNVGWMNITFGSAGSGDGNVSYEVAPNAGPPRQGTLTVAGNVFTVNQAGDADVEITLSATSANIGETVTMSVPAWVNPARWRFGGVNCDGETELDCTYLGGLCRSVEWAYAAHGVKTITLETEGQGTAQAQIMVNDEGSCDCDALRPEASFAISPNPAQAGETVTFTDTSGGGTLKILMNVVPGEAEPDIGETVEFRLDGVDNIDYVDWDFDGPGCSPFTPQQHCEEPPPFGTCALTSYKFASAGTKNVTVQVRTTTGQNLNASVAIDVQPVGSCSGGGGGCSYTLQPTQSNVPADGGSGSFQVSTGATCTWTATSLTNWVQLQGTTAGTGSGTVNYVAYANPTTNARNGTIRVQGTGGIVRTHSVNQAAGDDPGGGDPPTNSDPDEWQWTIRRGAQVVATSTEPEFTHVFSEAGTYDIELRVSNCGGSDVATQTLEVFTQPQSTPQDFVVMAAVHAAGINDTEWRTDLRIFNPGDDWVHVTLEYLPENQDNSVGVTHLINFDLAPKATKVYDDIVNELPVSDDESKGSLRISFDGDGPTPLIMSRTYNDTPDGTFGQFIPAVPVLPSASGEMYLTGLVHDLYYRTNVGLANFSDELAWGVTLTLLDNAGEQVGDPVTVNVQPYSTLQVVQVAQQAGVPVDLNIFSVKVETQGADLGVYASVVDNLTGDPVLLVPTAWDHDQVWVPGIAHLSGAADSVWRTDIAFFNAGDEAMTAQADYIPDAPLGDQRSLRISNLGAGQTASWVDVLYDLHRDTETKGYFVVHSMDDHPVPTIAARTYNLDVSGGTFGQNLKVFTPDDLVAVGEIANIAGVAHSPSLDTGFRSNLGLLNTAVDTATQVEVRLYDTTGALVGSRETWLTEGQFWQINDVFSWLGAGDASMDGSLQVEVLAGGSVAVYGSEVDNRTQDPILIPGTRTVAPAR